MMVTVGLPCAVRDTSYFMVRANLHERSRRRKKSAFWDKSGSEWEEKSEVKATFEVTRSTAEAREPSTR